MNARAALPAVRVVIEVATAPGEKSSGNCFPPHERVTPIDADAFRRWFAPRFAAWLHENFRSPEQVALVFGRDVRTAQNWWVGRNTASGDVVGLVFLNFPAALAWFLAEWHRESEGQ